ncbi:hypothetical protein [Nonomuraea sp. NPDC023979]|uniref:hypothetical protein n=1 Tax=Nonomuraea sp. NPDC023979 TaxID=3154796 RepID=UPI0033F05E8F
MSTEQDTVAEVACQLRRYFGSGANLDFEGAARDVIVRFGPSPRIGIGISAQLDAIAGRHTLPESLSPPDRPERPCWEDGCRHDH